MRILVAGASGFIGRYLVAHLSKCHQVMVLGRDMNKLSQLFAPPISITNWTNLKSINPEHFDSIINLCGLNIGQGRWTQSIKKELLESRVKTTEQLITWSQPAPNCHFYCANAIGIYGAHPSSYVEPFDENSPIERIEDDFLNEIGLKWQEAAYQGQKKPCVMRFGVVLSRDEGVLKKLNLSYRLGMGAIIGDGAQGFSWIHIQDLVAAIGYLVENRTLFGPFNLTSPNPVSQREFALCLSKAMQRPLWLKLPAWSIRLLFSEMGEFLLNRGQWVLPKRLQESGFSFTYPTLEQALQKEYE